MEFSMSKFLSLFLVTLVSFALLAPVADAKRMGGGKSFGMQRDNVGQQAPRTPAQQAQNPAAAGAAAPAAAGNRWLGPIAGLAAGGLLAAMFMGGAFDGIKPFDIVLMLGIAALLFFIIRAMRSRVSQHAQNMQYAGNTGPAVGDTQPYQGGALGGTGTAAPAVSQERPSWFDEQNFLRTAKGHFIRLQAASDKGDLNDIREYTTPEVYSEVAMQIQERNGAVSHTEVMALNTQLLDFVKEDDRYIASVRFYGTIREDDGQTEAFDEIWHIQRAVNGDGNWYIAGIQQTPIGMSSRFEG